MSAPLSSHGVLAEPIARFVAHKRALGRDYRTEAAALSMLDRYVARHSVSCLEEVTPPLIEAFLASRPRIRPRSYNHLHGTVRRLFDWLVGQEELTRSPVLSGPRHVTSPRRPFLFDPPAAKRLLALARRLPDRSRAPLRGVTYEMIFALLYGLGLRVGEACRLEFRDVDQDRALGLPPFERTGR